MKNFNLKSLVMAGSVFLMLSSGCDDSTRSPPKFDLPGRYHVKNDSKRINNEYYNSFFSDLTTIQSNGETLEQKIRLPTQNEELGRSYEYMLDDGNKIVVDYFSEQNWLFRVTYRTDNEIVDFTKERQIELLDCFSNREDIGIGFRSLSLYKDSRIKFYNECEMLLYDFRLKKYFKRVYNQIPPRFIPVDQLEAENLLTAAMKDFKEYKEKLMVDDILLIYKNAYKKEKNVLR